MGGRCYHYSQEVEVLDPSDGVGIGWGDDPRPEDPLHVYLIVGTNPDGRQVSSPTFRVDERELSLEQFQALAETITRTIATYTSWRNKAQADKA